VRHCHSWAIATESASTRLMIEIVSAIWIHPQVRPRFWRLPRG